MRLSAWFRSAMLAAAAFTTCGFAQDTQTPPQGPPEAGRGVGRISLVNGEVSVRRGDSGEWVAAVANAPVTADDHIATAASARAEVQFDNASFLRLGANSEAQFAQLEQNRYQIQVARGTVDFSVIRQTSADIEVDTPSVSVRPRDRGNYRITVMDDGQSEITVRAGQVEVYTPRGVETVAAGKTMMVRGDPSSPEYQIVAAIGPDDWDRWNADRDRNLATAGNKVYDRYVSPDVYGSESLEGHGRWVSTPDYGSVWTPSVGADWAPYRDGRWVWEDYYGWTWVSYDPWGWAPYHYGRWFFNAGYGGWCWWPGSLHARAYWAPAYVGFFGYGGGGFGVGFGFGNVGWVPLAPFELFHPWWGRGFGGGRGGFYNRTTIVNNTNIYNNYRNARVGNGVTAVNSRDFSSGRFNNFTRPSQNDLRSAGMVNGRLGITPSSRNMQFSDRAVSNVPRSNSNQRFFTRQGPVTSGGVGLRSAASPGGSFRPGNTGAATGTGIGGGRGSTTPQSAGGSNSGWRRFGDPATGANASSQRSMGSSAQGAAPSRDMNRGSAPAGGGRSNGNWRRFGEPGGQSAPAANGGSNRGYSQGSSGQRFGSPGSSSAPRSQFSAPSSSGRIQVNPPMVRERSAPQSGSPSYNRPSGGGSSPQQYSRPSTPQYSRPSGGGYSAPRSAPSPSYGGGRSSSGGGGSHSSSGGGGGHSSSSSHGGRR